MGIGSVLQNLLVLNNTNINSLSEKIHVSPQTLYSIVKRDNMKADLDVLFKICDAFDVDINVFYSEYKHSAYSSSEIALINNYRLLSEEGQEKASEYLTDLVCSGRYKKSFELQMDEKNA